jgi:hypothetical protein
LARRFFRDSRDAKPDGGRIAGQPIRVGWVSDASFGPVNPMTATPHGALELFVNG